VTELSVADPETVQVYEIGIKSRWWDNLLQLNGALFYSDYQDQQFVNVIGAVRFLENAGSSNIKGAEIELSVLPIDDLSINFGLGWLATEYDELSLTDPSTGLPVDLSGNRLPSAPKLNTNIAINYVFASGEWGMVELHADSQYVSKQWFSPYNNGYSYSKIKADAHTQSNARITFTAQDDSYDFSIWAKNIEGNDEPVYAINLQQTFLIDYYIAPLPFQYGIDFNWRF
jgi:iron complex outermembrane receptor protein